MERAGLVTSGTEGAAPRIPRGGKKEVGGTARRSEDEFPGGCAPRSALPCLPPTAPWRRGLRSSWREAGFPRLLRIWRIFGSGRSPFPRFSALKTKKTAR